MEILLDTHIFLWYISGERKLKEKYISIISDKANEIYVSSISIWECCIKQQSGRFVLPDNAAKYLSEKRILHKINPLPLDELCLSHLALLPDIHNDPFDRILICQAIENKFHLITEDETVKKYRINRLHFI